MRQVAYQAPAPRGLEIGIGVLLALVSAALIGVGLLAGYRMAGWGEIPTAVVWVATVFLGVGVMLIPVVRRLLTGRGRGGDGALLSSGTLRLGGLMFAVAPILALLTNGWHLLHLVGSLSMAAACFALAARRERASSHDGPRGD